MGKLCWYLVLRRNHQRKWMEAVDGVQATGHDQAMQIGRQRNPVKPTDKYVVERCQDPSKREYAEQLHDQRNQQVKELRQLLGGG